MKPNEGWIWGILGRNVVRREFQALGSKHAPDMLLSKGSQLGSFLAPTCRVSVSAQLAILLTPSMVPALPYLVATRYRE
jgi:hypothetical protein